MVRGAREYQKKKSGNFLKIPEIFLKNHKVHVRVPVGSIEGPKLVLDPMEVWSCVPRVPLNVFCCLEC